MSRCFPFPPPGYEKKPRSDHAADLLAKENHKEKKHKKEKRDREKREGKERKEKDKSKDKHKEKKDRKEKHKDKKRDKDRDKDKSRSSDDRQIEEQNQGRNEEKFGDDGSKAEDIKNSKFTEELGRRIRDEEGAANSMLENFTDSIQKRPDNMGSGMVVNERIQKRMGSSGTATEMGKEKAVGNKMDSNPVSTEQRRAVGNEMAPNVISTEQRRAIGYEMSPNLIKPDHRRAVGNEVVPSLINTGQRRKDGMARPVEDMEKRIEGKEKHKDREGPDGKCDWHKDKDHEEKRDKGKEKDKQKEKEKEKEKTKVKGEHKHREHDKAKDNGKKDQLDGLNCKPLAPHRDNGKSIDGDENIKKRKHFEMNGFLENDKWPDKYLRPASSSHLPVENGRTLQSCHIAAVPHSITKEGAMNDISKEQRVQDNKEQKINGISEALPSSDDLSLSIAVRHRENGEASSKPPHPDSKYLSQIYAIPKMDEWPKFDDHEWLFGTKSLRPKPKAEFKADKIPQVWAEALQIDLVDVLALPYVVPY